MNREFDQEPDEHMTNKGGSNTRVLLLVLLLLVAVFGYLYYFTGLIRPQAETPQPQPAATSHVKQPIPPRPAAEQPAPPAAAAKPAASEAAGTKVEGKPVPAKPGPAPAAAPKSQVVKAPQAKPEQKTVKAEPSKVAKVAPPAKPAPSKPAATAHKQAPEKSAGKEKKMPAAAKAKEAKRRPAKVASSKAVAAKKPAAIAGHEEGGEFTLKIGDYVVPSVMDKAKAKLHAAGLSPTIKQGPKIKEPMIRLYLAEYADQDSARAELTKLRDATAEAFMLNEGGKFRVYAGSYFLHDRALKERDRLAAQGIKVTLKNASVSVPTLLLTAGSFGSRAEALKAAGKLKKQGLAATVIEKTP